MDKILDQKEISAVDKEIHTLIAYTRNRGVISRHVIDEIIAGYTTPMIEKIVAELYLGNIQLKFLSKREAMFLMDDLLGERKRRLNKDFQWTDKTRARFLQVNNQLFDACKRGWQEAVKTADALEQRIKQRESFLKDYEISIIVNAYPAISGNRITAEHVAECLACEPGVADVERISHCHYHHVHDHENWPKSCIDESTNWNSEFFNGEFKDDYICYMIHTMLDSHRWSYPDILSVKGIWVNVEVTYQNYMRVPKRTVIEEDA
jgi:antirestriction protein